MTKLKDLGKAKEAAWFNEKEEELIRKARERKEAERARLRTEEDSRKSEELKKLHWMKCPKCGHDMREKSLEGIALDACEYCGGLYFDDGELEELLRKKDAERKGFFHRLFGA